MFRAWQNSLTLRVRVSPIGAIQIADVTSWDAARVGTGFVRAEGLFGRTVYLPASSLRGVVRSFSERLLLGLGLRACDPLAPNACGTGRDAAPRRTYLESCFACRTFGSGQMAGRVVVSDFWPWNGEVAEVTQRDECATANRTERRGAIAIDRRTRAGALGHETEVEVVTRGAFYGEVTLTNFQLWQAALMGLAIREMDQGYLTIGGGSGRGFGRVLCRVVGATIRQSLDVRGAVAAAADGAESEPRKLVGTGPYQPDEIAIPDGVRWEHEALADVARLSGKDWARLFEALADGPWRGFATSRAKLHHGGAEVEEAVPEANADAGEEKSNHGGTETLSSEEKKPGFGNKKLSTLDSRLSTSSEAGAVEDAGMEAGAVEDAGMESGAGADAGAGAGAEAVADADTEAVVVESSQSLDAAPPTNNG